MRGWWASSTDTINRATASNAWPSLHCCGTGNGVIDRIMLPGPAGSVSAWQNYRNYSDYGNIKIIRTNSNNISEIRFSLFGDGQTRRQQHTSTRCGRTFDTNLLQEQEQQRQVGNDNDRSTLLLPLAVRGACSCGGSGTGRASRWFRFGARRRYTNLPDGGGGGGGDGGLSVRTTGTRAGRRHDRYGQVVSPKILLQ